MNLPSKLSKSLPQRLPALAAVVTFMLAFALTVWANEPEIIKATVINLPSTGDASRIQCQLQITNPQPVPVLIDLPAAQSPLGYALAATPSRLLLNSRQQAVVQLSLRIAADGKYQVLIPIDVWDQRGQTKDESNAVLYLAVERGRYTRSTYRALFMNPVAVELDETGERHQIYRVGPQPAGWQDSREFEEPLPDVEELERMQRSTVFETDWRESPTLSLPPSSRIGEASGISRDAFDTTPAFAPELKNFPLMMATTATLPTAQGKLKYTGRDGQLHPCYGWRVFAFAYVGGNKVEAGRAWVKSNGNWKLDILFPGFPVKIEYRPRNRFFSFADPADNTYYSFSSQSVYTPQMGDVINEYTQVVYNANDSLVNLGELYRDGMTLWNALKNRAEGISPVRDESIVVYYPNTTYECGGDKPWSCGSHEGIIWILEAHGDSTRVMIHELSHQINFEYWENDFPGDGGPHNGSQCIDEGDALMEGFAGFMVNWVRKPRPAPPAIIGAIEIPPSGTCTTKNLNERWVAATFWDLNDTFADGNDNFSFTKSGATLGIYLKLGRQNSMAAYKQFYKWFVIPSDWPKIEAIFDQNHQ